MPIDLSRRRNPLPIQAPPDLSLIKPRKRIARRSGPVVDGTEPGNTAFSGRLDAFLASQPPSGLTQIRTLGDGPVEQSSGEGDDADAGELVDWFGHTPNFSYRWDTEGHCYLAIEAGSIRVVKRVTRKDLQGVLDAAPVAPGAEPINPGTPDRDP